MMQHQPSVVTLLEIRMQSHGSLLTEFGFSDMIEVPADGQAGGMVVLWDNSKVCIILCVEIRKSMQQSRYVLLASNGYSLQCTLVQMLALEILCGIILKISLIVIEGPR